MPSSYIRRERQPDSDRSAKVYVPRWVDPLSWVQGSEPEKMVMVELIRRGIYFEHTPQRNPLVWPPGSQEAWGMDPATIEPDFLFPQYHIWLEVQGVHWHTLPGQVERDALRFVLIEAAGWKPIFWWEDDIRTRLPELMNAVPEFYMVDRPLNARDTWRRTPGLPFYEGGEGIDHLANLRAALSARARPPQGFVVRRRAKGRRRK